MSQRYTFVTVAHAVDFGLLCLLARSMRLYCSEDLIEEFIIVENFDVGAEVEWRGKILREFGRISSKVRFIGGSEIATMRPRAHGWWRQQVCKLAVSSIVRSDKYVILDAKNHLVRQLSRDYIESEDGRPRLSTNYYYAGHPLQKHLFRTLSYFGVEPEGYFRKFARPTTPFTMLTDVAAEVVRFVEWRERKVFGLAFIERRLTEFFSYAGYLARRGELWSTYDMSQADCGQIWVEDSGCEKAARQLVKDGTDLNGAPFIATHRGALGNMHDGPRRIIARFWVDAGLFDSEADALSFSINPNGFMNETRPVQTTGH